MDMPPAHDTHPANHLSHSIESLLSGKSKQHCTSSAPTASSRTEHNCCVLKHFAILPRVSCKRGYLDHSQISKLGAYEQQATAPSFRCP
eukprot:3669706-Amphidinium_carterae.3